MKGGPRTATHVIEMESSKTEEGKIIYTSKKPPEPWRGTLSTWIGRILGIALGVGIFLLTLYLFVYVVVPLILISALYLLIRRLLIRR